MTRFLAAGKAYWDIIAPPHLSDRVAYVYQQLRAENCWPNDEETKYLLTNEEYLLLNPRFQEFIEGVEIFSSAGGTGPNIATFVAKCLPSVETHLYSAVGKRTNGQAIRGNLLKDGIKLHPIGIEERILESDLTASGYIFPDRKRGERFAASAGGDVNRHITRATVSGNLYGADFMYLPSTLIQDFGLDVFHKLYSLSQKLGIPVVFSPPTKKHIAEAHRPYLLSIVANTPKLFYASNDDETKWLFNAKSHEDGFARFAEHTKHAHLLKAVITTGKTGARIFENGIYTKIEPAEDPQEILCHLGAGDTYYGAIIVGIMIGFTLEQSARFAARCSSACIGQWGTQLPNPREILDQFIIEEKFAGKLAFNFDPDAIGKEELIIPGEMRLMLPRSRLVA